MDEILNEAQWPANTVLEFFNVPWNADYRDVVSFADNSDGGGLDQYLNGLSRRVVKLERITYVRPNEPIRVNIPYNNAIQYNFIRVSNTNQPVVYTGGDEQGYTEINKNIYYFINDVRHIAPNTTQLSVQIDVWSTYIDSVNFGYCYVERGHVGQANSERNHNWGRTFLTVPEGLDIGSEYNVAKVWRHKVADVSSDSIGVIAWSTTDLLADGGTTGKPVLTTAKGTDFHGLPNGASAFWFQTVSSFRTYLENNTEKPWKTQGIISIMVIPNRYYSGGGTPGTPTVLANGSTPKRSNINLAPNWRNGLLPDRYAHLTKFFTHPYCSIEITANTGSPVALKPEQLIGDNVVVTEIPYFALPSPRLVWTPVGYNRTGDGPGNHDGGEYLDITTGIYDFPTFSTVNNGYQSFLASNRHSINYQHSSADWSQQKALRGADAAYGSATMAMESSSAQAGVAQQQMNASTNLANHMGTSRAVIGAGQSLASGIASGPTGILGGVMGAGLTGVNEALNQSERNAQNTIQSNALRSSQRITQQQMGYNRDSNREMAQFSARGDYAQTIAGINAKVQDAKMTQPTTSGQIGGEAFNLSMDQWGLDVKVKLPSAGAMRVIGEIWLRYGYAVNAFMMVSDLRVMSKFSYWKMTECVIRSSTIAEHHKNALRGIMEKGVTVWSHPDYIGNTDNADNNIIERHYY